jgi:hypothetical protein
MKSFKQHMHIFTRKQKDVWIFICLFYSIALFTQAGHIITATVNDYTLNPAEQYKTTIVMDQQNIEIDTSPFTGSRSSFIFDASQRIIRQLDFTNKKYWELDERMVAGVGEKIQTGLDFLKEKFSGQEKSDNEIPVNMISTGRSRVIHGIRCKEWIIAKGRQKINELWTVPLHTISFPSSELQTVCKLVESFDNILTYAGQLPIFQNVDPLPFKGFKELNEFPVLVKCYAHNRLLYEMNMSLPIKKAIHPSKFMVPSGFDRRWIKNL